MFAILPPFPAQPVVATSSTGGAGTVFGMRRKRSGTSGSVRSAPIAATRQTAAAAGQSALPAFLDLSHPGACQLPFEREGQEFQDLVDGDPQHGSGPSPLPLKH